MTNVPRWFIDALLDIDHVQEIPGQGDNPVVVEAIRLAGLPISLQHDETAWCASYVTLRLLKAGVPKEQIPLKPAWARSYLNFGIESKPELGAIVVKQRVTDLGTPAGHVGFVVDIRNGIVFILGGNQGNRVCIMPFPEKDVLGYRMPS